jgi:bifunctional non-homologous end joining protein LigD
VNQGTIELHLYGGGVDALDEPRAVLFDLDPGAGLDATAVASVALELRERLRRIGLVSVVKTSGSSGMHVVVPLNAPHSFGAARSFAQRLARQLTTELPDRVVWSISRAERAGRVYIDWAQNAARRQLVAPYSLRATDVPLASTPLSWEEVEAAARTDPPWELAFGPAEVRARVEEYGDVFEAALSSRQHLPG